MKKWKVYLIHHTHFDIGYTHTQQEVLDIQFRNQEQAMELVEANRDRPVNAQFRWNPEATWALKEWLKSADKSAIDRFVSMVQSGHIGLDGLFANMHTALCRPEELVRMMDWKAELEELTGIKIDSAMITDVPGWNWGMVSALSERGIRYLSAGTNVFDRIGHTIEKWGDKPFYWVSPSGKEKILLWVHGKGYSWFHTGLNKTGNLRNKLRYGRIRRYLNSLERKDYAYDSVIIRYNIGGDNGPPDDNLSRIVEEWNNKHDDIELILSTNSAAMRDFEEKFGNDLPEFRGDFTAYWEDGALSTARETAMARNAAERITLAGNIGCLTGNDESGERFKGAWESALLFNEHTWGAHNSISRPDHPFAISQWNWKRQHASNAEEQSKELLSRASGADQRDRPGDISLLNSHNWHVSPFVEMDTPFDNVINETGESLPTQRLSSGKLAFRADNIPPLGRSTYRLNEQAGNAVDGGNCRITGEDGEILVLENDTLRVAVEKNSGIITSITYNGAELIDNSRSEHFNAFVRVPGKLTALKKTEKGAGPVSVEIIERGPLVARIRISRGAPSCNSFVTELSITSRSDEIHLTNILDRPVVRRKEGIHFAFPFNIPGGKLFYDAAWGMAEAETGQLPGANRNILYASRRIDIAGDKRGVSCVLVDAPAFKTGKLVHDPVRTGPARLCGWLEANPFDGRFYSYVMNNYWQTNFKADQPGETVFRYVFRPFGKYEPLKSYQCALENLQPPVIADSQVSLREIPVPDSDSVVLEELRAKSDGYEMRLYNPGRDDVTTGISTGDPVEIVSAGKKSLSDKGRIALAPGETVLIKVKKDGIK